ncbi:ABC transporter family protein (macronuclear) [Tetrahymena thermophila SB210]|uniref:ABC transporter family protein n=1 Tax=Tetrahymena thermophila (strain SB210) TaxID=312017 RepID=I7LVR3_TETTS|nr:ABC transporter family protein [Tetrahymena thermophila SB210]EAR99563.1 ABC transporter family protein [Tetrahymena thermophila SB210]|eukprot:XP_001019808.1 ABC transporter family protein [Tetrahymena thermophila SB210]
MSKTTSHLKALLKKNWILWRRSWGCSCFEILLPVVLTFITMTILRSNVDRVDIPQQTYFDKPNVATYYPSIPTGQVDASGKAIKPPLVQCIGRTQGGNSFRNGYVALIPETGDLVDQVDHMLQNEFGYQTKRWPSVDALYNFVQEDGYRWEVCFGIELPAPVSGKYSYQLLFNNTGPPTHEDDEVPDTTRPDVYKYKTEMKDPLFDLWVDSGFLTLQHYIDNLILKKETGNPSAGITAKIYPIQSPSYTQDKIDEQLSNNFGPFMILPMILSFLRLVQSLLVEKEKKIREGMKIMGMQDSSFYLSYIIQYLITYTVISLLMAMVLKISIFKKSDYFFLFIWFWLFTISLIFQALFVQAFFTRSKIGTIISMIWFLLMYMADAFFQSADIKSRAQYTGGSFSTHCGIIRSSNLILVLEANMDGIGFSNDDYEINNFDVQTQILMNLLNIAVFAILAVYLDQVIPNEFGRKRKPLFFLDCFLKKNKVAISHEEIRQQRRQKDEEIQLEFNNQNNIEDVTQLLKDQENRNEVLKIRNLQKTFHGRGEPFKAVDKLNLTMYKDQIFVLLGHNGAGKTTTLSMLTGLLTMTGGWAEVNGMDIETQMEEIRTFMGVCPQHDILFDNLTVREHLYLYASFKGMTDSKLIKEEVEKFVDDVDLREKADVLSKNLSGGQRRRLSVAIAFIGGSQIVYLDEPTSGMDTSARRYIWDMLKQYRNDRIVILTTHFMDEADYLGDRIAIMGKGKLICCGSSEFLKDRFGVGYNLTIVKEDNTVDSAPIINFVKSINPSINVLSDVSAEITIQMKSETVNVFPTIFKGLDSQKSQFKIESYGISITTLEEVFLRVADLEHANKMAVSRLSQQVKEEQEEKEEEEVDNFDLNSVRIKSRFLIFCAHFRALCVKRFLYFRRDIRGLLCEVLLPILIVIVGLAITLINNIQSSPSLLIEPSIYDTPLNIIYSGIEDTGKMNTLFTHFNPHDWKATFYNAASKQDWDNQNFELRSVDRKGSYYINKIDNLNMQYAYETETQTISCSTPPLFINQMNNAILQLATGDNTKSISVTLNPFPLPKSVKGFQNTTQGIVAAFNFAIGLSLIPASLITLTVKEREEKSKHQQLVSGVSIISYWTSNYAVDMIKHLFPSCICICMVLAYDIDTFASGENLGAISILFILYGWGIIPFTYSFGFLFQSSGSAQVTGFFFNFLTGAVLPVLVMVLRIIKTTNSVALKLQWVFRILPSFCFGYGVTNMANKQLYATVVGSQTLAGTYDMDMAGGDIMCLAIEGAAYFLLVFIIEFFKDMKPISQIICPKRNQEIKYLNNNFDSDVQKEMDTVAKTDPKEYTVRVNNIRKVYYTDENDPKVAVDRVSFGIKEGDCFGLLGINGAGKTTTFKILAGEIQQSSGQAHIKGYDLRTQMSEAQKHIGYCPQFDALLENLTAREHLELYAAIKGIPYELREGLVAKKIKEMGLSEFEHKLAGTYSGGNKRKLSVAIAMLGNPPIVFLDEPSTGMDPEARRFMWNVISRISTKRKQSSIILTTHSMEEAEALCTRLTIMVNGAFKCLGTLTQIKNKFGQGYEVVVKTEIPKQMAEQLLKGINVSGQQKLTTMDEIQNILTKLGSPQLIKQFDLEGSAKTMFQNINKKKGVTAEQLAEYVCIENDGERIQNFIRTEFGKFSIIEHFSNLYRFKITNPSISIGKVFEQFEHNKRNLNIASYNVRQATIEQIFNNFAEGRYDHEEKQLQLETLNKEIPIYSLIDNKQNPQKEIDIEMGKTNKIRISPSNTKNH